MEKRNDYFLIPKQFSFEAFEVSDEENMSDHNALTATVAVPAFQQQAKLASLVTAYKE
ncbi:hypothetical protein D3C87_1660230 [compost metagenome]